ncbi:hypothetical protein D3C72_1246740 [compost metagenome]
MPACSLMPVKLQDSILFISWLMQLKSLHGEQVISQRTRTITSVLVHRTAILITDQRNSADQPVKESKLELNGLLRIIPVKVKIHFTRCALVIQIINMQVIQTGLRIFPELWGCTKGPSLHLHHYPHRKQQVHPADSTEYKLFFLKLNHCLNLVRLNTSKSVESSTEPTLNLFRRHVQTVPSLYKRCINNSLA